MPKYATVRKLKPKAAPARNVVSIKAVKSGYAFERGFPKDELVRRAYDEADLNRAVQCYKFFYPTLSGAAMWGGNVQIGMVPNAVFGIFDAEPTQLMFTADSDMPCGSILLDLSVGPLVIELPPGPLMVSAMDIHQRGMAEMGLAGPDSGRGGMHLLLPPGYQGNLPAGYYAHRASSTRQIVSVRALPVNGDMAAAKARLATVKVYPLAPSAPWEQPRWLDVSGKKQDTTPASFEGSFKFWEMLHTVIDAEPVDDGYPSYYGELAMLGIEKGKPFKPDARMKRILDQAAKSANAQMRVQAFADRRSERTVWKGRQWQWSAPRFGEGDAMHHLDSAAREKWFYQAVGASRAMSRRDMQAGSVCWLGLRDKRGAYLDGGKNYTLSVPLPIPGNMFWSLTVYDAETRSQIQTKQNKAALRSLVELKQMSGDSAELYFGPKAPKDKADRWIQTIPGKGWFACFRIYGPQEAAFDGAWNLGDFVQAK